MKDRVIYNVPHSIPQPYHEYITQRNGTVAEGIANYLDISYGGNTIAYKNDYQVLAQPRVKTQTYTPDGPGIFAPDRPEFTLPEEFYGALVEDRSHVGKAILHPALSRNVPRFYSSEFAQRVQDFVIPGFTAFHKADVAEAFPGIQNDEYDYRLKLPDESDGYGQFPIHDTASLQRILESLNGHEVAEKGVVLEANLHEPTTISVGYAMLGRDQYSFIAHQKNDDSEGRSRYRGAEVTIIRGTLKGLTGITSPQSERGHAVEIARKFYDALSLYNVVASRLSFDCLHGFDNNGYIRRGVTDITARLGGTCPALILAAHEFKKKPGIATVSAEVNLNYDPTQDESYEERASIFVNHPTLRLSARVNDVERYI